MLKLNEYKGIEVDFCYYDEEDVKNILRLQNRLFIEENIIATFEESANIWQKYSSDLCASWLFFPDKDEEILFFVRSSDFFDNFENYSK